MERSVENIMEKLYLKGVNSEIPNGENIKKAKAQLKELVMQALGETYNQKHDEVKERLEKLFEGGE